MLALYFRLIGARIRAQMQYKLSFWLDLIGFGVMTGIEFLTTVVLLQRFGAIAGWSIAEVALLYGFSSIAFGLTEMIMRGFDRFGNVMIATGAFDAVLTRPLGAFFQVLSSEFQLRRLGRVLQGCAAFGFALSQLAIGWTPAKLLLMPLTLISGTVIFSGVYLIGATLCFWTVRPSEIVNVFTNGGQMMTTYPQSIFNEWMRGMFLFVVPVAFASYPAALVLLDRGDPNGMPAQVAWAAPLVAVLFFIACFGFWGVGVRKYASTGS